MSRTLNLALFTTVLSAVVLFMATRCRQPDNTNRIRPATDTYREDLGPLNYTIKKDGIDWPFPARTFMREQTSINGYGNYGYSIEIDNSFTRNDTLFYEELTFKLDNVTPATFERTFNYGSDATVAFYKTGNQYKSIEYSAPGSFNPNPTTSGFVHIISQNNSGVKLEFSVTPYKSPSTFEGTIQFAHH